jgi:hypothetical protein
MVNLVNTVKFYQHIGTDVLLNAAGDTWAYKPWMKGDYRNRLPAPDQRDAVVKDYVDVLEYLRKDLRLTNVRYLSLFVEPANDPMRPMPVDEYVRLHKVLDRMLKERGMRQDVVVLGSFDSGPPRHTINPWCAQVLKAGILRYVDGIASHTYNHRNPCGLTPWVQARLDAIKKATPKGQPVKPFWITEFGYAPINQTFRNDEIDKYEYGLFVPDFTIQALKEGVSGLLIWCLAPVYYSPDAESHQLWSLWYHKDRSWEPRPPFYSWSLLSRYCRPGSQVLAIKTRPDWPDFRSVALRSPEGKLTILVVNRGPDPRALELRLPAVGTTSLRQFLYSRDAIPTPDQGMIKASAQYAVGPGRALRLVIPGESFLLLTEMED